jgi:hypothetical protein
MEIEEIIALTKEFDDVIKYESRAYLISAHKFISYQDKDDDKKYITNGLKRFVDKNDKIIYLVEAINYLNEELSRIIERIDYTLPETYTFTGGIANFSIYEQEHIQDNQERKVQKRRYESQIFYAVRELEKLGINGLSKNAFSKNQVADLTRKIDALLIKIDELTVGQEIIFNHIDELKTDFDELKSDFPLGKKRWYQRFSGIAVSYLGNKGADALYDLLKPDIMKILQDVKIDKLLH